MKFLTRELYQGMQGPPDCQTFRTAEAMWRAACDARDKHLESIRAKLPPGMQAFVDTTLHDGVVLEVGQYSPQELYLGIDATRNPWGPMGFFRLRFLGVK